MSRFCLQSTLSLSSTTLNSARWFWKYTVHEASCYSIIEFWLWSNLNVWRFFVHSRKPYEWAGRKLAAISKQVKGVWGRSKPNHFLLPSFQHPVNNLKDLCFVIITGATSLMLDRMVPVGKTWAAGSPAERPSATMGTNAPDKKIRYYFNPFHMKENWPVKTHSLQKELFCNILFAKQLFKRN